MINVIIIIFIIALDRISKALALAFLYKKDTIPIIKDVFHLTYAQNTGAAFSIFKTHTSALAIVSVVASIGISYYLYIEMKKKKYTLTTVGLSFIVGGTVGNLYDRAILGFVVDFFDFRLINFAIFNVADSFITVGAVLLVLDFLLENKWKEKKQ